MLRLLLPLSSQVHDLLSRVFVLSPAARISIKDFRTAISKIKYFAIPAKHRAEFHDYQRAAWSAAIGPSSSHSLSVESLRIKPVAPTSPSAINEEEGIDITDGAKEFFSPFITNTSVSLVQNIPIVDRRPPAPLRVQVDTLVPPSPASQLTCSSVSSAESDGPITPDMPATVVDVEVPDITQLSQEVVKASSRPTQTGAHTKAPNSIFPAVGPPFQNILRAIGAL